LITELSGKLDFAINAVISPHFRAFAADVMELGIELNKLAPGVTFCNILPFRAHAAMSEQLRKCGHNVFEERFRIIRHEHRFINLLCRAETVKSIKIVYYAISKPARLCQILPLEPCEKMAGQQWIMNLFPLKQ
jgi:hypothetical protein